MNSKVIILFVFSLLVIDVFGDDDAWSAFKLRFAKNYDPSEDSERKKIFEDNLLKIEDHNKKYAEGLVAYKLGINKFADLKPNEISEKHYTGLASKQTTEPLKSSQNAPDNNLKGVNVPESMDWRKNGAVTSVKNQGNCSTCWAFSAVGAIEGHRAIRYGILESLSEQQILDCLDDAKCESGRLIEDALRYVQEHGLKTSQDYPYVGIKGDCKAHSSDRSNRVLVESYQVLKGSTEDYLKLAVGSIGPVAAALKVDSLINYQEGIFHGNCTGHLNHAVLVVGYDKDNTTGYEYWIIKNSWGSHWGEHGYLRLKKGNSSCGIADMIVYTTDIANKRYVGETFSMSFNLHIGVILLTVLVLVLTKKFYSLIF